MHQTVSRIDPLRATYMVELIYAVRGLLFSPSGGL